LQGNIDSNLHDSTVIKKNLGIIEKNGLDLLVEKFVIENHNWKFVSSYPAKNKKTYSWQELYNIAKIPKHFSKAIQNHFSSFTHGLGLAILYTEGNNESLNYIYDTILILQAVTGKIMRLNYSKELENLNFNNEFIEIGEEVWSNWE